MTQQAVQPYQEPQLPAEEDEALVSVLIRIANSLEAIALVLVSQENRWKELDQELDIPVPDDDPYRLA